MVVCELQNNSRHLLQAIAEYIPCRKRYTLFTEEQGATLEIRVARRVTAGYLDRRLEDFLPESPINQSV